MENNTQKYYSIVSYMHSTGIGGIDIFHEKKLTTKSQLDYVENKIIESNPGVELVIIMNVLTVLNQ